MNEVVEELPIEGTAPDLSVVDRLKAIAAGLSTNTHTLRDQVVEVVRQLADEMAAVIATAHDISGIRLPSVEALAPAIEQLQNDVAALSAAMLEIQQQLAQLAPPQE